MTTSPLRVTVLGSGTSSGVPVPACDCDVCRSPDPRNRRLRCSVLLRWDDRRVLVDTGPDLRQQVLRAGIRRLDAVLWTHSHADHIHGFDDLRSFSAWSGRTLPGYGTEETLQRLRTSFAYAFGGPGEGGALPRVELRSIDGPAGTQPFRIGGRTVIPIPLLHGTMEVTGYRMGDFAYCPDCNRIPAAGRERLAGVRTLVLDGLRPRPHPTHFSIEEAVAVAQSLGAERTWLTHCTHDVDHAVVEGALPDAVRLAYDGLEIVVP